MEIGRSHLPNNEWLQRPLKTVTNYAMYCNAFYDGTHIVMFRGNQQCGNTGENAAVVLHEWGHGIDDHDLTGMISKPSGEGVAGECRPQSFFSPRRCESNFKYVSRTTCKTCYLSHAPPRTFLQTSFRP